MVNPLRRRKPIHLRPTTEAFDWVGFVVRFTCGAAFGFFATLAGGYYLGVSMRTLLMACCVGATLCGLLAAWLKNDFWRNLVWWPS